MARNIAPFTRCGGGFRRASRTAWVGAVFSLMTLNVVYGWEGPGDSDKALPCRPTIACTADLVSPGTVELETGVLHQDLAGEGSRTQTPWLAKFTLATWLQLQAAGNGFLSQQGSSAGPSADDIALGAKIHLVDQGAALPSLSVSAAFGIPASQDTGAVKRTYDAFFTGYATRDFGPVHADFNAGINLWHADAESLAQHWLALALSAAVSAEWTVMAETYYFTSANSFAAEDGGVLAAVSYAPHPWIVWDVGADLGYFPASRRSSVFAGVTWIPGVMR